MALMKGSEPSFMTAEGAALRGNSGLGWRAESELKLRNAIEAFCRERWPAARVVHELVMGAREVRADVVAIGDSHVAAFEVKGYGDTTVRMLHQVGMYQLCVPEVWMVCGDKHAEDANLIRHLLPSVGLIVGRGLMPNKYSEIPWEGLDVAAEAVPRPPVPEMMLEMLWADELRGACQRLRISADTRSTRPQMIRELLAKASVEELQRETCTALRGRDAVWRADSPVAPPKGGLP